MLNTSAAANGDIIRVKIFNAPSGGSADEFVKKTGDEMTGELNLRTSQPDGQYDYTTPSIKEKHLRFSTTRTDTDAVRHAYLFQPGYSANLATSGNFISGGTVSSTGYFYGYSASGPGNFVTFSPRIYLTNTYGGLYWDGGSLDNRRVYLTGSNGYLYYDGKYSAKWNKDGFYAYYQDSERFKTTSNGTYFTKPIYVYNTTIKAQSSAGNSSSGTYGNAGQVLTSQGSNPPRWMDPSGGGAYVVDGNNTSNSPIKITKTSGVYYITGG